MTQQAFARCFAILPSTDEPDGTWIAINEVCDSFDLAVSRADRHRDQSSTHTKNLSNQFHHHHDYQDSDIIIVDLTRNDPSALFEFGYAIAMKNKYVIPLTQGMAGDLPENFRNYMFLKYKSEEMNEFKINLASRLRAELSKMEADRKNEQLLKKESIAWSEFKIQCFSNRDNANLNNVFSTARKEIKILQTNMATVVNNYMENIHTALQSDLFDQLEVNFLALDPESYFAAVRADQLGKDRSEFRSDLRTALIELHERFKDKSNVEIRIYDDFPTQISYIIDGFIYNCVVSKYQPSRNNCVFMLEDRYPSLHTSFVLHFTSVWRDNKTTRKFIPLHH
jgi:hypothetical protein